MLDNIESKCLTHITKREYSSIRNKQFDYVYSFFTKYKDFFPLKAVENEEFGFNLVFIGKYGEYYFPASLYRVRSYKNTIQEIMTLQNKNITSFIDLQDEIFNIQVKGMVEAHGYSHDLLESLYFYTVFFNDFDFFSDDYYKPFITRYSPYYFSDFSENHFKKNKHTLTNAMRDYPLPSMQFWNLGALLFSPEEEDEIFDRKLPIYPYWLLTKGQKSLLTMYRIAPEHFSNKFEFRDKIVTNIDFFINLNYLQPKKGGHYFFYLPDLFKCYDQFTNQGFAVVEEISNNHSLFKAPNWQLTVPFPKKKANNRDYLQHEEENLTNFILSHQDVIIHLFNTYRSTDTINIPKILGNLNRRNIFTNLFLNRLRIEKFNQQFVKILIWVYFTRNHRPRDLSKLIIFFQAIYPDGIIVEYQTGLFLYVDVAKAGYEQHIMQLKDFLHLFNLDFKIYKTFENQGFLQYSLPSANYFNMEIMSWVFENRSLAITPKEFSFVSPTILENEKNFENSPDNKERIKNFVDRVNNI